MHRQQDRLGRYQLNVPPHRPASRPQAIRGSWALARMLFHFKSLSSRPNRPKTRWRRCGVCHPQQYITQNVSVATSSLKIEFVAHLSYSEL